MVDMNETNSVQAVNSTCGVVVDDRARPALEDKDLHSNRMDSMIDEITDTG